MTRSCPKRPPGRATFTSFSFAALLFAGCVLGDGNDDQTIQGRVDRSGFDGMVLGARIVRGDAVVATSPLDAEGRFTLHVPEGTGYRLEVITSTGPHPTVRLADGSLIAHTFDVCNPVDPFDLGDVYQGDVFPQDWWPEPDPDDPPGCDPNSDGTCTDPDQPPPDDEPGCGGDRPEWCPPEIPIEQCWDPCSWDPMACEDPCALYPEFCDPCAENPDWCQDPCLENPELCEDPCGPDGTGCEDPCQLDPSLCECPDGTPNCDPCELDPWLCDPCFEYPELCDPCLQNPEMCDPCLKDPSLCEDPCGPDGTGCEDPCLLNPELCDPCVVYPELCDPCIEHPELCEDPCYLNPELCDPCLQDPSLCPCEDPSTDPDMCWPPDDVPCDENGVCDPGDCSVPQNPIPDFGCEGGW